MIFSLVAVAAFAQTAEASSKHNFWQEFDITFWQTLPFAALWGHFADRQISAYLAAGSGVHWELVVAAAALVSAGNAYLHAQKATKSERTGDYN